MHYSENIGRILRLFREERTERTMECVSNFDTILKSKVVAELLLNSQLATPELNRENVALLLSGKLVWPKENGADYIRNLGVDLSTLEQLGMVSFYADYCQVHVRGLPEVSELDESCQPIHEALELLRNIVFGREGFIKPYFKIEKKRAHSILENRSLPNITTGLKDENGSYHIDSLEELRDSLVAEYLWEAVVMKLGLEDEEKSPFIDFSECQKNLMGKWLLICRVYSDNYLSDIHFQFMTDIHKKTYFTLFESLITSDYQLKQPKFVLDNKRLCSSDSRRVFLDVRSEYLMEINPANNFKSKNSYKETKTKKCLGDLEASLFSNSNEAPESNLAFYNEVRRRSRGGIESWNFYSNALGEIINSDIFVDRSCINSYGKVDGLLEKSNESYELRLMLLNDRVHFNGVKYLIYLLIKKETATTALYIFANNPHSNTLALTHIDGETYHLEYFPVVCDEFIDVYFNDFCKIGLVGTEIDSSNDIVELLILMAKDSIQNSFSGELNARKDCLDILLSKFTLEQISIFYNCLLLNIENDKEKSAQYLPGWKFYLLFWLLEKAQDSNITDGNSISEKTQVLITYLYCEYFNCSIDNNDHMINAYKLFDFLPWWRIDSEYIPEYFGLIKKPSNWTVKLSSLNEFGYKNKDLVRSYFQLLLGLHTDKRNDSCNRQIISKILSLLECCGFSDETGEYSVIFDYESQYDYLLWRQFTLFVEELNDDEFKRVASVLRDEVPLNKVLELYSQLQRESRKSELLQCVVNVSAEKALDNLSIVALEESLDFACSVGQLDIAKLMLDKGLFLLSDKDSYLNTRISSSHISKLQDNWKAYEFKVGLLVIISDVNLSDEEKLEKIREPSLPFKSERTHQIRKSLALDCERFKRQMSALILYEIDPEAAYRCFDSLYGELRTHYFSGNRFASKLKLLDQSKDSPQGEYKVALNEWLKSIVGVNVHEIDFNIILNWLHCLNKMHDYRGVDAFWNGLSKIQQHNVLVATSYCKSLIQREQHLLAQSIFEKLKGYHNVISLGEEADKQLLKLEKLISKDIEPIHVAYLTNMMANKPKSIDELRSRYIEIKSKKINDVVTIVGELNSTVDSFLYEEIKSIVKELQLRKSNLNGATKPEKKEPYRIIGEDLINDWVTSLFDHRLSYIGLSCRDQKRGGRSGSPGSQNPGEIDFFLCGNSNERIAIMEAFRLFSNDTTVIQSHLNKVAGYDQECLSPVFIIAYCDVVNFEGLCDKYYEDTKVRNYSAFEKSGAQDDNIQNIESSQTVNFYKEVRYRNRKPIVIYHMMINLRFEG